MRHAFSAVVVSMTMATMGCPSKAHAYTVETGGMAFSLSGFGTLGEAHSTEHNADFTSSVFKPGGTGFSHNWSSDVDSLIGVQLAANLAPRLSAVVQIISAQNYANNYKPHVEWANIKYQFTPDFSIRLGQIVLPTFLFSDIRKVGFANPWVRPPLEVYTLLPITYSDGVDASYRVHVGAVANTLQSHLGETSANSPYGGGAGVAKMQWGFTNTTEFGNFTAHVAYQEMHFTTHAYDPLFRAFTQFGQQGVIIAAENNLHGKVYATGTVGAVYDPGHWFVMGEWAHAATHSLYGSGYGAYVTGGYRAGKLTPFLTYAKADAQAQSTELDLLGLPPNLAGLAAGLNATLAANRGNYRETMLSAGCRWDFFKNLDLKMQLDSYRNGAGSRGNLSNLQPGFQPGGTYAVFTAAVDFVF